MWKYRVVVENEEELNSHKANHTSCVPQFKCDICDVELVRLKQIQVHVKREHTDDDGHWSVDLR